MKKTMKMRRSFREELQDLRRVFFPRTLHDRYLYLGSVPWNDEGDISRAMLPLVLLMDHKAKPSWCPRWFLRFLHKYGNDNSVVRVRNWTLHELYRKLTKGYFIWDYKAKWQWYDLRISISGDDDCQYLADTIEDAFYRRGRKEEMVEELKELCPDLDCKGWNSRMLEEKLASLLEEIESQSDKADPNIT